MSKTIAFEALALGVKIRDNKILSLSAGENVEKGWCPACGKMLPTSRGVVSHLSQVHALRIAPRAKNG